MREVILSVKDLKIHYPIKMKVKGKVWSQRNCVKAVDGISFDVYKGETLGIVGESGCGKSTIGNTIIRLLKETGGQIRFKGTDITKLSKKELNPYRRQMQMIFQDPFSSLNPRKKVFDIIAEPFRVQTNLSGEEMRDRIYRMMELVGLDREYADRYPHEFSGGQRQRIGIARALALNPELVICDEPVSALDVSIQAQILNLLKDLQEELNLTYIFIAHGMPAVQYISDRIAVMYLGKIMEIAPVDELFAHTMHPYTEGLLSAIPIPDPVLRDERQESILEGDLPSPLDLPKGCRFCSRCRYVKDLCREREPEFAEKEPGHFVCCHFPLEH